MHNVIEYGADPTGAVDSSLAFAQAIKEAVEVNAARNLMGSRVLVPEGNFRLDRPLDLFGNVLLEGFGTGRGNGASRISFGVGSGIIIHSSASSPHGSYAGGASVRGLDIFGSSPSFKEWNPYTEFALGDCIRSEDDSVSYYECVAARPTAGIPPRSGPTPLSNLALPELSILWAPGQSVAFGCIRRASTGNYDWYFRCSNAGLGITGNTEPNWTAKITGGLLSPGEQFTEAGSNVVWVAKPARGFFLTDGNLVWRSRFHTGILMLASSSIEKCSFFYFANAGISVVANIEGFPSTNANSWHVSTCNISGCGQGMHVQGTDANGGTCLNVTAIDIGSSRNRFDANNGFNERGHAFLDVSQFGNTYIGCVAETVRGRSYCTADVRHPENINQRCAFINCYLEENCYPGRVGPGTVVLGGAQFAVDSSTGFSLNGAGLYFDPLGGVGGLKIRASRLVDSPSGALDLPNERLDVDGTVVGSHSFFTLTDSKQGGNHFGWSRGDALFNQGPFFPNGWTFATSPYNGRPYFGVAGNDHPSGPHWRDFLGHWRGLDPGEEQYYLAVTRGIDKDPGEFNRGLRPVGFRQEPRGGYQVGGKTFVGRMVVSEGYEGQPWESNATGYSSRKPSMVVPPVAQTNGFVYRCIKGGTSGPGPIWPTALDADVDDNEVIWRCVGRLPVYKYYGECIDP